MNINSKLQAILITQLQKYGTVELLLPDGVILELGITQIAKDGEVIKAEDYCWVIASRQDKQIALDKYNLSLKFNDKPSVVVFDEAFVDNNGHEVRRLEVI